MEATLALAAGIAVGLRVGGGSWVALGAAGAAGAALLTLTAVNGRALAALAFAAVGFAAGGDAARRAADDCRHRIPDGIPLALTATLVAQPAADGRTSLDLRSYAAAGITVRCSGRIRARLRGEALARDGGETVAAGALVVAWGRWWATPPPTGWPVDGERAGTFAVDSLRPAEDASAARANLLQRAQGRAQERIRALFGERAGIVEALLLARRDGLDPALRDRFVRSGLVHLLAISGFHVGLVAGVLILLCRLLRLRARAASLVAGGATLAYVAFLGAPHPAARAGLQVCLVLAGRMLQRPSNPYAGLSVAALVLLAADPLAVLDPGFQLSFAGAAGLVAIRPRLLAHVPDRGPAALRDALATNVAASATTTPLAAYHFGQLAPIGLAANLVAVPLLGLAVPALALALAVSLVSFPAGAFIAGAGKALLAALDATAELAARVPCGHGYASRSGVVAWTAAGLLALYVLRRSAALRPLVRRTAAAGTAAALLVVWPAAGRVLGHDGLEVHAIDVGQGDAYAIRTPAGRWLLVDAGPRTATFDAGRARVVPYLLRQGVRRLEYVILTHPDGDHIGGTAAILEAFPVGAIIDPAVAAGKPLFVEVVDGAASEGVRWLAANAGRELRIDEVELDFLFPDSAAALAGDAANDRSVVFRLSYGEFSALFTGDAPAEVKAYLVTRYGEGLRSDVLKVGHHGSRTSTDPALLSAASPELALISVGRNNRYGHPAPEVLRRLERAGVRVLRTDLHGAIRLRAGPDGAVEVDTERE